MVVPGEGAQRGEDFGTMSVIDRVRGELGRRREKARKQAEKAARQAEKERRQAAKQASPANSSRDLTLRLEGPEASFVLPEAPVNRAEVRKRANREGRAFYHHLARQTHRELMRARTEMGRAFVERHRPGLAGAPTRIDPATGLGVGQLPATPVLDAGLEEARGFVAGLPDFAGLPRKNAMIFAVSAEETLNVGGNRIDYDSAIRRLACDPHILVPVIDYLGAMPILFSATVNVSPNEAMEENSSQYWHLDPEDVTQVKVFIYLDEVDARTGPFTALPADKTERLFRAQPDYGIGRVPDETVAELAGPEGPRVFTGGRGTAVFCDTTRCLHFGSRPGDKPRSLLFLMYSLPTSTWFPLFPGDGEAFHYIARFQDARATAEERALLGMELTPA
jgi:hypothetical protein